MISYAGTRGFLDAYTAHLRVLGNIVNVDIVNISVEHEFMDGELDIVPANAEKDPQDVGERGIHTATMGVERKMAEDLAQTIWAGVEGGGIATIGWPARKYVMRTAARGSYTLSGDCFERPGLISCTAANPLVQQFQKWAHARHEMFKE